MQQLDRDTHEALFPSWEQTIWDSTKNFYNPGLHVQVEEGTDEVVGACLYQLIENVKVSINETAKAY